MIVCLFVCGGGVVGGVVVVGNSCLFVVDNSCLFVVVVMLEE